MGVVERTMMWAELKEKRMKQLQDEKLQQDLTQNECTFKPQINTKHSRKVSNNQNQAVITSGLDKYLLRMDKAKSKKEEQQQLEDKLFKKGQNWKPQLTQPKEPKLSGFINKGEKVKSLVRPVSPYRAKISHKQNDSASQDSNSPQQKVNRMPNMHKTTEEFVRMTEHCRPQFVDLKADMNYEEAISLIHQHIINLDI